MKNIFVIAILLVSLAGCSGVKPFKEVFSKRSAYEIYVKKLSESGIDETGMGADWLNASLQVFKDSLSVELPFKEQGYLNPAISSAAGYTFSLKRGSKIKIRTEVNTVRKGKYFIDLFYLNESSLPQNPQPVASASKDSLNMEYEAEYDGKYLLRLQPEILRGGTYLITITVDPVYAFPVSGKNGKSIGSLMGAPRDRGARLHQGIDIFANRGTPVLAVTEGMARNDINKLGGKVVWLRDSKRNLSVYYAHLDSQVVREGSKVKKFDTLGFVGNTGNANRTVPHLHFGIYGWGGAIDPFPYVYDQVGTPRKIDADAGNIGKILRTKNDKSELQVSPSETVKLNIQLEKHLPVIVLGASSSYYRVLLFDNRQGFIKSANLQKTDDPLMALKIKTSEKIYRDPDTLQLVKVTDQNPVKVYARINNFFLINPSPFDPQWIEKE